MHGNRPFVGRTRELARLHEAFEATCQGETRIAAVAGEPGIGKTRLAEELERYARERGALVLWGQVRETAGAPPYWPWIKLGRALGDALGTEELPALLGSDAAELQRLFPELRDLLPGLPPPEPALEAESARFRLFEALAATYRRLAAKQPVVLVLDDLHWADAATLLLLQHLAAEVTGSRIMLLLTYRDGEVDREHPLSGGLAELNRLRGFELVTLSGLSEQETTEYVRQTSEVAPAADVERRIYEVTEGNPFFTRELVHLLAEDDGLVSDPNGAIPLSAGVRAVLGRHLERLTPKTHELLRTAAIVGREFTHESLGLLAEGGRTDLVPLLEEALGSRVIEATGEPGRYRFVHALMQEAFLTDIAASRRALLHGEVAEALERRWGDRAGDYAARLAYHYGESATLTQEHAEKAFHYSAAAGRRAMDQSAYPEAVRYLKAALAVRDTDELNEETAAICLDLGRAADAILDREATLRFYERAFEFAVAAGDGTRTAAVAAAFADSYLVPLHRKRQVMSRALELVEPGSIHEAGLRVKFGIWSLIWGYLEEGNSNLARAHEIAESFPDSTVRLGVLLAETNASGWQWQAAQTVERAERLIELARAEGNVSAEFQGHFWCIQYFILGRLAEGRRHADLARELAEASKVAQRILTAVNYQALGANHAGDWEASQRAIQRGLELSSRDERMLTAKIQMQVLLGDYGAVDELVGRLIRRMREIPKSMNVPYCGNVAWIIPMAELLTGRQREQAELDFAAGELRSLPALPPLAYRWLQHGLAIQSILDKNVEAAEERLRELEPFAGDLGYSPPCIDHIRALLMETAGRPDDAIETLEMALRLQHPDFRPGYAWSAYECARIRADRGAPGDEDRARVLVGEATGLAQELGMNPLLERLDRANERFARDPSQQNLPGGLTPREAQVLGLIAVGKANPEIAESLVLSTRTIERHIQNIYNKLGVHNRVEAANWAREHSF